MRTKGRRQSSNVQKAKPSAPGFTDIWNQRGSPFAKAAQTEGMHRETNSGVAERTSAKTNADMERAAVADRLKIKAKQEGRAIANKSITEYQMTGKKPQISEFDKKKYKDGMNIVQTQVTPGKWVKYGK
jgi:hypothetical protein